VNDAGPPAGLVASDSLTDNRRTGTPGAGPAPRSHYRQEAGAVL